MLWYYAEGEKRERKGRRTNTNMKYLVYPVTKNCFGLLGCCEFLFNASHSRALACRRRKVIRSSSSSSSSSLTLLPSSSLSSSTRSSTLLPCYCHPTAAVAADWAAALPLLIKVSTDSLVPPPMLLPLPLSSLLVPFLASGFGKYLPEIMNNSLPSP